MMTKEKKVVRKKKKNVISEKDSHLQGLSLSESALDYEKYLHMIDALLKFITKTVMI